MKKLTVVASLLLSLMFAFGGTVAAQTDLEGMPDLKELGLNQGYMRMLINLEAAGAAGSSADAPMGVMMLAMEFEDEGMVEGQFETVAREFSKGFFDGEDFEMTEVQDLGDAAYAITGTSNSGGEGMPTSIVIARDGTFVLGSITLNSEVTDLDQQVVTFMLDNAASDTEVTFNNDGTSTGGVFDRMPTGDDVDGLNGMQPMMDMDFLNMGSTLGTPEAGN